MPNDLVQIEHKSHNYILEIVKIEYMASQP